MDIKINEKQKDEKKKMIALELSETLYQKLRKEAFDREISVSAVVRYACELLFLNKNVDENEK